MKALAFYHGKIPNQHGLYLVNIHRYNDASMENDHAYIQWMFPLNEKSAFNVDAPILTREECELFQKDEYCLFQLSRSFHRFLQFLDMGQNFDNTIRFRNVYPWWLQTFNHNCLRATRVIRSLRLLGQYDPAKRFYDGLMTQARNSVPQKTIDFWTDALNCDLWSENDATINVPTVVSSESIDCIHST